MQPKVSKPTDIWESFARALLESSETRPEGEGWRTYDDIRAELHHIPEKKLREGLKKCEIFKGYVTKNNKLVNQVWYRPNARE